MLCTNCKVNVPPEFVICIENNMCPACGEAIYTEEIKELFDGLANALNQMPNDIHGIVGWLLSHYHIEKIGTGEPVNAFHRKPSKQKRTQNEDIETSASAHIKMANNPVHDFLKRTGKANAVAESQAKLQALAQHIQSNVDDDLYVNEDEEIDDEYDNYVSPQASAKKALANMMVADGGEQPLSPEETAKIMDRVANSTAPLDEGSQALQLQRMRRLAAQQGVIDGSGQGVFRRGD